MTLEALIKAEEVRRNTMGPREQKMNKLDWRDHDKVTIVPMEMHLGSKDTDELMILHHLDWIAKTPDTYVLFMGDNIEAATRDSVGAGVYEQTEIIDEQVEHFCKVVKPLVDKGKVIGMHDGNHEARVYKACGVDIAKLMAKQAGIKYFGRSIFHYAKVGDQNYVLYSTHGSSGARLPHTKIKSCIDRANSVEADVYIMGHLHTLAHHTREMYYLDKKAGCVKQKDRHFVICGSYLNHWGSYGEQAGYELLKKGSPKIKLSGIEHRVRISL